MALSIDNVQLTDNTQVINVQFAADFDELYRAQLSTDFSGTIGLATSHFLGTVIDTVELVDSHTAAAHLVVTLSDTLALGDQLGALCHLITTLTDQLQLMDIQNGPLRVTITFSS
jgi:hypothetical protein